MNVFISYRRDDSITDAALIGSRLTARGHRVFMDVDGIAYGDDFVRAIDGELGKADVVLVVIGPRWTDLLQQRLRGDDWVRHEVGSALRLNAASAGRLGEPRARPRVLPVLVKSSRPPAAAELPADMADIARRSMLSIDERALNASFNTLLEAVQDESFVDRADEAGRERRVRLAAALAGIAAFLAGWMALFDLLGLDTRQATATMALAAAWGGAAPRWSGQVVLVAIDEGTVQAVGRPFDAGWRAEHARLVRNAAAAGARSVAFDLFLEDAGPPAADAALADALAASRGTMPVIFGVGRMNGAEPAIAAPFRAAAWGIACSGYQLARARSMTLAVQREVKPPAAAAAPLRERVAVFPSLGLAAFSGGGRVEPIDEGAQTVQTLLPREQRSERLSFYAAETVSKPQPGCEAVSKGDRVASQLFDPLTLPALREPPQRLAYQQLLQAGAPALSLLKDKIVLVGLQFAGLDTLPLGAGGERWGVELIAAQVDAMTRGAAVRPLGGVTQWLLTSALGLLGVTLQFRLRRRPATLRVAALLLAALGFAAAAVWWYRSEQQMIGVPYGLAALALGAWAAGRRPARQTRR